MLMRRLKRWIAPFIRECLLIESQPEEQGHLITCLSCAKSNLGGSCFCSCCGKPFLAKKANLTYRMQNTDPIGTIHKDVFTSPLFPQQSANTHPSTNGKLRPFLGYVKKYRHEGGASGHTNLAHRNT